ncbi:hypothetical protein PHMEG_00020907 [Phytophthora megakarya]|uniref:Uncharacterized protein n=1 Tax=Phytophthora megakarya TaxID=4795 RepID=A0A225VN75_9STRA|nr:hypothetical protein PHMEG_00020907 [Phytophthora megakarya]
MPPKLAWNQRAELWAEYDFVKYRRDNFWCSTVFSVWTRCCTICLKDHEMAERHDDSSVWEMREYIQHMDENEVPPRMLWSNMLRAPEVPPPFADSRFEFRSSATSVTMAAGIEKLIYYNTIISHLESVPGRHGPIDNIWFWK